MVSKQRSQWAGVRPPAPTTRVERVTPVAPMAKAEATRSRPAAAVIQSVEWTRASSLIRASSEATSPVRTWHGDPTRRRVDCCFSRADDTVDESVDDANDLDDDDSDDVDDSSNQDADAPPTDDGIPINSIGNAASTTTSRVAALNRELKALELRYFRTREQVEKTREQVS